VKTPSPALLLAIVVLAAATARGAPDPALERYDSPPLSSSSQGIRYAIGFPAGWELTLRGERTRAIAPGQASRREPEVFIEVAAVGRDEPATDRLLLEEDGLAKWVTALDPRRRRAASRACTIDGRRREVLIFREQRGQAQPDRQVLAVAIPAPDVTFVIIAAAPLPQFSDFDPLFTRSMESFEVRR
jgi:hypothetical protein